MVKNLEARRPTLRQTDEEVKVFFSEVTCVVFYCSAEVLTIAEWVNIIWWMDSLPSKALKIIFWKVNNIFQACEAIEFGKLYFYS